MIFVSLRFAVEVVLFRKAAQWIQTQSVFVQFDPARIRLLSFPFPLKALYSAFSCCT